MDTQSAFSKIYATNYWGDGSLGSPLSGSGSVPENAKRYVEFVARSILNNKISTVLDVGHGDWAMWRDYKFEGVNYTGIDLVHGLSDINTSRFGRENIRFFQVNNNSLLPQAELLICKDVLQHLSLIDIESLLTQINQYKYIIFCNDIFTKLPLRQQVRNFLQPKNRIAKLAKWQSPFFMVYPRKNNGEIMSGAHRGIDLEAIPFRLKFEDFELIDQFDYDGDGRVIQGQTKRVYLFKKVGQESD